MGWPGSRASSFVGNRNLGGTAYFSMRHVYVDTVVCMVGGGFIWSDHNYASL